MSRAWIFQCNPKHYDIDGALRRLDKIWWRVPQYTAEIGVGDQVVLWRSGNESGVVGVGLVLEPPQQHDQSPEEAAFALGEDELIGGTTRTLMAVRSADFVSKDQVRSTRGLEAHQIVTAPMGTVFPLTSDQWAALALLLPEPPSPAHAGDERNLPPVFAWGQRAKGVMPMPGGYDGYLISTRRVCELATEARLTPNELADRMATEFDLKPKAARLRESFLRRMGLIKAEAGICQVTSWARMWTDTDDPTIVVGLLHSRCRFIGEMMSAVETPQNSESLLAIANDRYGLVWDTNTQLVNRRGWLQSAGMVTLDDDKRLVITDEGRALLSRLDVHPPGAGTDVPMAPAQAHVPTSELPEVEVAAAPQVHEVVEALADELVEASTDSSDPDRFERAVRDAFAFLGFQAEWLGGAGKTDVLLEAPLGKDDRYQVTVDAKTSASGSVSDGQVDWVTLKEHRTKHDAEHTLLVGPDPSAGRLLERAADQGVAVLSARQLAGLVRQHDRAPVGLHDYRLLFSGGEVDTAGIEERSDDAARIVALAAAICDTLTVRTPSFGRLTARDLWLILADEDVGVGTDPDEIQHLLDTLASPLLGVLDGTPQDGYVTGCSIEVAVLRLRNLGTALASGLQSTRPEQ